MNNNKKDNAKLRAVEAFIASEMEGPEKGLSIIGDSLEPNLVRKKIAILLNAKRPEEAVNLINELRPNKRWCDVGLRAYLEAGKSYEASQLLNWIKSNVDDEILINKCRLIYAEITFNKSFHASHDNMLVPGMLTEDEVKNAGLILDILKPILAKVTAEDRILNKIELGSVQLAITIYYLLQDNQSVINLSKPLFKISPLPLEAARMVMRGIIIDKEISNTIPHRLRTEHNSSLDALLIAAVIECEIFKNPKLAFANIKKIILTGSSESEKNEYGKILFQISQYLDIEESHEALRISQEIFGPDHKITSFINIDILIKEKDFPKAKSILGKIKDENDALCLQLYAKYFFAVGQLEDALECLTKTRAIMPHPEILKEAARVAFETENYDVSSEILEQVLKKEPDNISLINNLAAAYFKKGNHEQAAKQYEILKKHKPEEQSYLFNLASCYTQMGESGKAIKAYEEICSQENAPLKAFLAKAYLEKIDDPKRAFATILPLKEIHWENPQYLQAVLDLSCVSGNDSYMHEALLKIKELQEKGKAPQEILQVKTIDDLIAHASQWDEKLKVINQNLLKGRFTWLMADSWQNHTTYMGWYVRSQKIDWLMEDPLAFATYSIYSTNGFTPRKEESDDTVRLSALDCPEKGSDAVIDLSSLITLHQLNLLDTCIEYFNTIYIPREYVVKLLQDSGQLVIHQHSIKTSAQAIKSTIVSGDISILDDIGIPEKRPLPYIHEHTLPEKEEEHYYRLIDIIMIANNSGKLNVMKYNSLKRIAHKSSGVDSEHPELRSGQSILVELSTLHSICQTEIDALEPILNTFKIFISKENQIYNSNQIRQIENQEMIRGWNDELLDKIKGDAFSRESHKNNPELAEDNVFLASFELAKDKGLPLLVDDRVLQVLATNTRPTFECPSFGTDRLLLKFHEEDMIDIDTLSDAFLKLMKWRYRFILPSIEILLNLAKRYKGHLPGQDLQKVALYIHECMRDPGLFGGQENTTLKESMAARTFLTWVQLISEFLAKIWEDSDFNEDNAKVLTEWAITEFLPAVPKCLGVNGIQTANNLQRALFNYFYALVLMFEDTSIANKALQCIAEALKMDEPEYFKAVSEVVDKYGI